MGLLANILDPAGGLHEPQHSTASASSAWFSEEHQFSPHEFRPHEIPHRNHKTSFSCHFSRPAVLPKASCPGVGAEQMTRKSRKSCAVQPPACCEAARRAEAAAKQVEAAIDANPILKIFSMFGRAAGKAEEMGCDENLILAQIVCKQEYDDLVEREKEFQQKRESRGATFL